MVDTVMNFLNGLPWWAWVAVGVVVIGYGLQNDRVGALIVLTIAYALIGTGLHGIWSTGLPQATASSLAHHFSRIQAEKVRVAAIRKDGQELVFRNVCPDFFEQGWMDRQLSSLRWCNDYRDRL